MWLRAARADNRGVIPALPELAPRRLRRPWRVLLLLVPALFTVAGGVAAILAIEHVRDTARHQGTVAAVANANATQARQAALAVSGIAFLVGDGDTDGPDTLGPGLAQIASRATAQHRTLIGLVGDDAAARAALRASAASRTAALQALSPPITRDELLRAGRSLSTAAGVLDELSRDAAAQEREADERAKRVTIIALALAVLVVTASWWAFLALAGRMQRRHVDLLRHLADHDPLTGLGNRRALGAAAAALGDTSAALAMCDLDGFKTFNDRFGHVAGDALLLRVAERLAIVGSDAGARAFRLGGDEFCVLAPGIDPARLAELCRAALTDEGDGHRITASVGTAQLPDDGDLRGALLVADSRLYEVKRARYLSDPSVDRRNAPHQRIG